MRASLSEMVFVSDDPEDAVGRLESTYRLLLQVDDVWQSFARARGKGELEAVEIAEALQEVAAKGIINVEDIAKLADYDARRYDCLLTDDFDQRR